MKLVLAGGGFALCLIFITFQVGKSVLAPEDRLTPIGLHSVMSPAMDDPATKLYTDSARLIPPLIDHFSDNGSIRLNFVYLSPDCLQPHLLERANEHALTVLENADTQNTFWGLDWALVRRSQSQTADGAITFSTKGAHSMITLVPSDEMYVDNKNLITKASSVTVKIDNQACGGS
ncbi:MAG: hypothetical protein V3T49_08495, partial [Dehalococcoidia bacterium]